MEVVVMYFTNDLGSVSPIDIVAVVNIPEDIRPTKAELDELAEIEFSGARWQRVKTVVAAKRITRSAWTTKDGE